MAVPLSKMSEITMATESVLVLMSTYNGASYLREQLDSIFYQDGVNLKVLVRDDGSHDETCAILEEYASLYDNLKWYSGDNLGFVGSFSELINVAAMLSEEDDEFYAFADQDDIWKPAKLRTACNYLSLEDRDVPNLFTSNSMMVGADGCEIGLFHEQLPRFTHGNLLVYSTEQGCSMVFNRKALEIYNANPPQITFHDRWMNLICFYLGKCYYENAPLFYYRIHGGNALGKIATPLKSGFFEKIFWLYAHLTDGKPLTRHVEMAKEFFDRFGQIMGEADKRLFSKYISYRYNLNSKLYILFSNKFRCPYSNWKQKILFFLYFLYNKM